LSQSVMMLSMISEVIRPARDSGIGIPLTTTRCHFSFASYPLSPVYLITYPIPVAIEDRVCCIMHTTGLIECLDSFHTCLTPSFWDILRNVSSACPPTILSLPSSKWSEKRLRSYGQGDRFSAERTGWRPQKRYLFCLSILVNTRTIHIVMLSVQVQAKELQRIRSVVCDRCRRRITTTSGVSGDIWDL
jgi:hypothetical protein